MEGFIKLYRQVMKWEWYDDANTFRLFIHLLLKANYEDAQWRGLTIKRGQLFTSIGHLSHELKISNKAIRIALDKLTKTKEVASKGASNGTMITICKYDSYQSSFNAEGQTDGQTRGKRGATNNNNNNNNNNNKLIDLSFLQKDFIPLVEKWLLYKKEKKQEYKGQTSVKAFCKKLVEFSGGDAKIAEQIIEQSISNNWAGIFELKNNNNGNKQQNGLDADAQWRAEMQASIARDYAALHE